MLNLTDLNHSDVWNPLATILADKENIVDNTQTLCRVIVENTGSSKDIFKDSVNLLLNALVLYVVMDETLEEEEKTLSAALDLISSNTIEELENMFALLDDTHPAKRSWNYFLNDSANKKGNVINSLGSRLQTMQNVKLGKVLGYDEYAIDLVKPAKEKCAYFLVINPRESKLAYVSSLFFTMFFIQYVYYAETEGKIKGNWIPCNLILDEFCNIGTIPNYAKIIATVRSAKINVSMIVQGLSQLYNPDGYGQTTADEIVNNSNTKLFLGTSDLKTAEHFSKYSGTMTVNVNSESRAKRTFDIVDFQEEFKQSSGEGKRPVLLPDEVMRKDEEFGYDLWGDKSENFTQMKVDPPVVLLLIRESKILKLRKFDFTEHPEHKKFKKKNISLYEPEWMKRERLIRESVDGLNALDFDEDDF